MACWVASILICVCVIASKRPSTETPGFQLEYGDLHINREKLPYKPRVQKGKPKAPPRRAWKNPGNISIEERPESVATREEFGHWEMDTIVSCVGGRGGVLILVERQTRFAVTSLLTASAAQTTGTLDDSSLAGFTALRGLAETSSTKWDGVDPSACVLLLNPTEYAKLLALLPVGVIGDGYNLSSEKIGAFIGFKAVASAPTITGTGFIVPDNAIAVVNRVIAPAKGVAGNLVEFGIATDEISGFTHTQRVVIDAAAGKVFWTTEALFGAKLTREVKSNVSNGAPGFISISLKA